VLIKQVQIHICSLDFLHHAALLKVDTGVHRLVGVGARVVVSVFAKDRGCAEGKPFVLNPGLDVPETAVLHESCPGGEYMRGVDRLPAPAAIEAQQPRYAGRASCHIGGRRARGSNILQRRSRIIARPITRPPDDVEIAEIIRVAQSRIPEIFVTP